MLAQPSSCYRPLHHLTPSMMYCTRLASETGSVDKPDCDIAQCVVASASMLPTPRMGAWRLSVSTQRPRCAQASILQYARRITEAATEGQPAVDCVIAVPPWFGPAQRQALLDAGQVPGSCPAS